LQRLVQNTTIADPRCGCLLYSSPLIVDVTGPSGPWALHPDVDSNYPTYKSSIKSHFVTKNAFRSEMSPFEAGSVHLKWKMPTSHVDKSVWNKISQFEMEWVNLKWKKRRPQSSQPVFRGKNPISARKILMLSNKSIWNMIHYISSLFWRLWRSCWDGYTKSWTSYPLVTWSTIFN